MLTRRLSSRSRREEYHDLIRCPTRGLDPSLEFNLDLDAVSGRTDKRTYDTQIPDSLFLSLPLSSFVSSPIPCPIRKLTYHLPFPRCLSRPFVLPIPNSRSRRCRIIIIVIHALSYALGARALLRLLPLLLLLLWLSLLLLRQHHSVIYHGRALSRHAECNTIGRSVGELLQRSSSHRILVFCWCCQDGRLICSMSRSGSGQDSRLGSKAWPSMPSGSLQLELPSLVDTLSICTSQSDPSA